MHVISGVSGGILLQSACSDCKLPGGKELLRKAQIELGMVPVKLLKFSSSPSSVNSAPGETSGMVPDSKLPFKNKSSSAGALDISGGIEPIKLLLFKYKILRPGKLKNDVGISPVKTLLERSAYSSFWRLPRSEGIGPVS